MIMQMERWNPWWTGDPDPAYVAWSRLKVKWVPDESEQVSLKPFSLNFVSGPRQVGKTTMLKLLINRLLQQVNPKAVLYLSCDEFADFKELGEALDTYLRAKASWGVKTSYIFLDEVTFVDGWWRAVKSRIDDGSLLGSSVTVTGSASIELLKQREMFPGRRGHGVDVVMRPLNFHSYLVKVVGIKPAVIEDLGSLWRVVEANKLYSQTIADSFTTYLETGGFPLAIREFTEYGRVGEASRKALLDGLRGDWLRAGKSEATMKEVVSYLLEARAAPLSWLSIAKNTSINSPHTARSYVEVLKDLMTITVLSYVDPSGRTIHRKNKKIHFADPFIHKTLAGYCGQKVYEDALMEGVVASHLARRYSTGYWRNKSEVDCVVVEEGEIYGFEVKTGLRQVPSPKWLKHHIVLDKETTPLFLAGFR
jgi:predicted AAA+ superfamily ATPase